MEPVGTVTPAKGPAARRAKESFKRFRRAWQYFYDHQDELVDDYDQKWVAVSESGVVASSKTRRGLSGSMKKLPANQIGSLYIDFVTKERQTLIL